MTSSLDDSRPPMTNWAILAGLRFFLAWIVISEHIFWFATDAGRFFRFFDSFGGKAAVIGFLMVSGYSMAASLRKNVNGFYRRRLIRLYPLYFTSLIAAVVLQVAFKEVATPGQILRPSNPLTMAGNFLFLQTFLVKPIAYDPVVWSLSIEFAYYLLAPFLIRLSTRTLLLLIVVSGLAYLVPRTSDGGILLYVISKFNALRYLWAWLLGFVCYLDRRPIILIALAATGLTLVPPNSMAFLTIALSFLIMNYSGLISTRQSIAKILNYLGDLSYPLYLVHFPCFILCVKWFGVTDRWALIGFSLLTTVFSYHFIDIYCKKTIFIPIINKLSLGVTPMFRFIFRHQLHLVETRH